MDGKIELQEFNRQVYIDNVLDDSFNKISKSNGVCIPLINYNVSQDNEYFKVKFDNQTSNEIMKNAEEKINNAFKTNEERLSEIDYDEIEEKLKKLKI